MKIIFLCVTFLIFISCKKEPKCAFCYTIGEISMPSCGETYPAPWKEISRGKVNSEMLCGEHIIRLHDNLINVSTYPCNGIAGTGTYMLRYRTVCD